MGSQFLSQKKLKQIRSRERRRMSLAEEAEEVRRFFNDQAITRQIKEEFLDNLVDDYDEEDFMTQEEYDALSWWHDPDPLS